MSTENPDTHDPPSYWAKTFETVWTENSENPENKLVIHDVEWDEDFSKPLPLISPAFSRGFGLGVLLTLLFGAAITFLLRN